MKFKKQNIILAGGLLAIFALSLTSNTVFAATFGDIIDKIQGLGGNMVALLSTWFYVGGVGLAGWGLWDWYQSGQQGSQVKMKTVVLKLASGICLVALPFILDSGIQTIGGDKKTTTNKKTGDLW